MIKELSLGTIAHSSPLRRNILCAQEWWTHGWSTIIQLWHLYKTRPARDVLRPDHVNASSIARCQETRKLVHKTPNLSYRLRPRDSWSRSERSLVFLVDYHLLWWKRTTSFASLVDWRFWWQCVLSILSLHPATRIRIATIVRYPFGRRLEGWEDLMSRRARKVLFMWLSSWLRHLDGWGHPCNQTRLYWTHI